MGTVARVFARRSKWALACAAALGLEAEALAQDAAGEGAPPPPLSLSWSAPEECPSENALRAEVSRLAPEAGNGVPGFDARGTVRRTGGVFELELETRYGERHGSRRMQDASCTELTRAAAVVIALAIRPDSGSEDEAPPPPAPATSTPVPAATNPEDAPPPPPPAPEPPRTRTRNDSRREPLRFELWAGAKLAGELGTLPGFAPGVALGLEARTALLRVGLGAELLPTQRTSSRAPEAPLLAVDYAGGDALGCVGLLERKLAPGACAGVGVGRLRGRSRRAPIPGEGSTLWVTPRLGAFVLYRVLPVLALEAGAHARFATKTASFTVENFGPVYESEPIALLLEAGATVRIW